MSHPPSADVQSLVDEALAIADVASAVVVVRRDGSTTIELAAAAGIAGAPLDGLVTAIQDPRHPVNRALDDPGPTFDVRPMNPGGPALRSHLPIRRPGDRETHAVGVLAVAHDLPTTAADRERLADLADRAGAALG